MIHSGAIGQVHTVDIWTTRASTFWKQGLPTPTQADAIPANFNWDLWLGPAVATRKYGKVRSRSTTRSTSPLAVFRTSSLRRLL